MARLDIIAQRILDQYNQDYLDNESFFDLSDAANLAAGYYSNLLEMEFQQMRRQSRSDDGVSVPEISAAWLITQTAPANKLPNGDYEVVTQCPIFSFKFDAFGYGLQSITSDNCKKFQKVSNDEWLFIDLVPINSFCFYKIDQNTESGTRLVFLKNPGNEVALQYVPAAIGNDENAQIADGLVSLVIENTLKLMIASRSSTAVNQTDDENKNKSQQSESNTNPTN